jgi:hypothetical protein
MGKECILKTRMTNIMEKRRRSRRMESRLAAFRVNMRVRRQS